MGNKQQVEKGRNLTVVSKKKKFNTNFLKEEKVILIYVCGLIKLVNFTMQYVNPYRKIFFRLD